MEREEWYGDEREREEEEREVRMERKGRGREGRRDAEGRQEGKRKGFLGAPLTPMKLHIQH